MSDEGWRGAEGDDVGGRVELASKSLSVPVMRAIQAVRLSTTAAMRMQPAAQRNRPRKARIIAKKPKMLPMVKAPGQQECGPALPVA